MRYRRRSGPPPWPGFCPAYALPDVALTTTEILASRTRPCTRPRQTRGRALGQEAADRRPPAHLTRKLRNASSIAGSGSRISVA